MLSAPSPQKTVFGEFLYDAQITFSIELQFGEYVSHKVVFNFAPIGQRVWYIMIFSINL